MLIPRGIISMDSQVAQFQFMLFSSGNMPVVCIKCRGSWVHRIRARIRVHLHHVQITGRVSEDSVIDIVIVVVIVVVFLSATENRDS